MSQNRLNQYGFQLLDTRTASDHFPKITDFSFDTVTHVLEELQLTSFHLNQNYPNPFNPSTKIGFHISDRGFVSLKVYDVLGNEVATLVNEELAAGEYEVEFNSVGTSRDLFLPSGTYFYQLRTEGYINTKKMMLLK